MRRVSNSEIQTWKQCRRKWYLQYSRKLVRKREDPLGPAHLGTRVHEVIAYHYWRINPEVFGADQEPLALHDELVAADLEAFPDLADAIRKEADLSRAICEGYFEWLEAEGADEGLEIVAPEQVLRYEILPGVELQGRIDVRVKREVDGARMVLDHKTVQEFTTPARLLSIDEQMKTYLLLERLCDTEIRTDGAIYNMLRKVKRTASAKPPFFQRIEQRHNDHVLRNFFDRLVDTIRDILAAESADPSTLYPSPSRDCTWRCPFLTVCPLMDDETSNVEALIDDLYEVGDPYERYSDVTE